MSMSTLLLILILINDDNNKKAAESLLQLEHEKLEAAQKAEVERLQREANI